VKDQIVKDQVAREHKTGSDKAKKAKKGKMGLAKVGNDVVPLISLSKPHPTSFF
jgi:hypothetical protein